MTATGAKFSLAIISRVVCCRVSSAAMARWTAGSVSARERPSTLSGSAGARTG
jgi:hypothetical protein